MFRYLNLENTWPGFVLDSLINIGGALQLRTTSARPEFVAPTLPGISLDADGLAGPASIGMDSEGNVYIPDSTGNRILLWRACGGLAAPVCCLGGEGSLSGQFKAPRGVVVGPRGALYVADSGNHRIQIFDLATSQLRGIWGQPDPHGEPVAGSETGRLNDPWDLAADSTQFLYIVDHGNHRIQKFDADGKVLPDFWETLRVQSEIPGEPAYIAVTLIDGEERLVVIDRTPSRVLIYRMNGTYDASATEDWLALAEWLPGGLIFMNDDTCADKAGAKPALVFDVQGNFVSEIREYSGPLAGLILDKAGRLLIRQNSLDTAISLLPGLVYSSSGDFTAGPFFVNDLPSRWQRVQANIDDLPPNTHIQFFTYTGLDNKSPAMPPAGSPAGAESTGTGVWRPVPMDITDFLVLHEPAPFLWIGGVLQGDGQGSPTLHQIRLEFANDGWLRYLPAIYGRDKSQNALLERTLALFESQLVKVECDIDDLPSLFDPWAAPDPAPGSWLDWLSGWLAFELEESWAPSKRRHALASAFDMLGRRGTVQGLRQYISWYVDIDVRIEEPAHYASVWSLGENSVLGFTTMLAAAEPQGAVLSTTATLGSSHLIRESEYGAPLFNDLSHRFCVLVASAELTDPDTLEKLRRVIDREKPTHTNYQIHVIEPRMRVGEQGRLGVDAIIAGAAPTMVLDAELELGFRTALAERAPARHKVIGTDTRLGVNAHLV